MTFPKRVDAAIRNYKGDSKSPAFADLKAIQRKGGDDLFAMFVCFARYDDKIKFSEKIADSENQLFAVYRSIIREIAGFNDEVGGHQIYTFAGGLHLLFQARCLTAGGFSNYRDHILSSIVVRGVGSKAGVDEGAAAAADGDAAAAADADVSDGGVSTFTSIGSTLPMLLFALKTAGLLTAGHPDAMGNFNAIIELSKQLNGKDKLEYLRHTFNLINHASKCENGRWSSATTNPQITTSQEILAKLLEVFRAASIGAIEELYVALTILSSTRLGAAPDAINLITQEYFDLVVGHREPRVVSRAIRRLHTLNLLNPQVVSDAIQSPEILATLSNAFSLRTASPALKDLAHQKISSLVKELIVPVLSVYPGADGYHYRRHFNPDRIERKWQEIERQMFETYGALYNGQDDPDFQALLNSTPYSFLRPTAGDLQDDGIVDRAAIYRAIETSKSFSDLLAHFSSFDAQADGGTINTISTNCSRLLLGRSNHQAVVSALILIDKAGLLPGKLLWDLIESPEVFEDLTMNSPELNSAAEMIAYLAQQILSGLVERRIAVIACKLPTNVAELTQFFDLDPNAIEAEWGVIEDLMASTFGRFYGGRDGFRFQVLLNSTDYSFLRNSEDVTALLFGSTVYQEYMDQALHSLLDTSIKGLPALVESSVYRTLSSLVEERIAPLAAEFPDKETSTAADYLSFIKISLPAIEEQWAVIEGHMLEMFGGHYAGIHDLRLQEVFNSTDYSFLRDSNEVRARLDTSVGYAEFRSNTLKAECRFFTPVTADSVTYISDEEEAKVLEQLAAIKAAR
jgi:hypothetical protein